MRRSSRTGIFGLLTVATCIAMLSGTTAATAGPAHRSTAADIKSGTSSATAYQEDAAHDGSSDDPSFTAPLTKLWSTQLTGSIWYPLIVGNTIFVDAASDADGSGSRYGTEVSALSATNGQVIWGPKEIGGTYSFGGLTYDDGQLFALNFDGQLWDFDATTGVLNWSTDLPGQYAFTSSPTASDGTVYVSGSGSGGTVYAVAESDGSVRWTQSVENGDSSAPAVDSSGVYVSYACEQAYSFTVSGTLRWHHSTNCEGGGGRTDVLHDGDDYIRDDANMGPTTLSETDGSVIGAYSSSTAPSFDGSTMVSLSGGYVTASDLSTGTTAWQSAASDYTVAPIVVNGYVAAGEASGNVKLLDERTGAVEWSGSAGSEIDAPDEHNAEGVVGLAEANGFLAVPAGRQLTVFASSDLPIAHITGGPAPGAYVRSTVTFTFGSNVSGSPMYTCTLDGVSQPCASPFTATRLGDGNHTFAVAVAGESGDGATETFHADGLPPSVAVSPFAARFVGGHHAAANWVGEDAESGLKHFDLRVRRIDEKASPAGWRQPTRLTAIRARSKRLKIEPGVTKCIEVRAIDRVGNLSQWSPQRCVSGLIDDHRLAHSRGWHRGRSAADLHHSFIGSDRRGAVLRLAGVTASRVAIVALACPSCGAVEVSFGGENRRIALHRAGTVGNQTLVLPRMSRAVRGTLRIRVLSRDKPVQIDAVGVTSPQVTRQPSPASRAAV